MRIEVLGELRVHLPDGTIRGLGGRLLTGHLLVLLAEKRKTIPYTALEPRIAAAYRAAALPDPADEDEPEWRPRVHEAKRSCVEDLFGGDASPILTKSRLGYRLVRGETAAGTVVAVDWDKFTDLYESDRPAAQRDALALVRGPLLADEFHDVPYLDHLRRTVNEQCAQLVARLTGSPVAESRDIVDEFMTAPAGSLLEYISPRLEPVAPSESEALRTVRRLSRAATRDGKAVGNYTDREGRQQVRYLDDDLWVPRQVERDLVGRLEEGVPATLLVGEPGTGKTSLLSRLVDEINHAGGKEALLLKASAFLLSAVAEHAVPAALTVSDVREACAALVEDATIPVVLLDTADVLLRGDSGRDLVSDLIDSVTALGGQIALASRPQEATLLGDSVQSRVQIGRYSDDEIESALSQHVEVYYNDAARAARELQRITDFVSNEEPVGDLLRAPLTMRVTFELYAPHQVPAELNAFLLYREYWRRRIDQDRRTDIGPAVDTTDLSWAAETVAALMLSQGAPEIPDEATRGFVRPTQIDRLVTRGVLVRDEEERIRFFHQTFFEHAAGRWFAGQSQDTYGRLISSFVENPQDLFRAPVVEQALLHRALTDRPGVEQLLGSMIGRLHAVGASAALVFNLIEAPSSDLIATVRATLVEAPRGPATERYLHTVSTIASARVLEAADLLAEIWVVGENSIRERVARNLCFLASRDPRSLVGTLDALDVVPIATELGSQSLRILDFYFKARALCAAAGGEGFRRRSIDELTALGRHDESSLLFHSARGYMSGLLADSDAYASSAAALRDLVVTARMSSIPMRRDLIRLCALMRAQLAGFGDGLTQLRAEVPVGGTESEGEAARFAMSVVGAAVLHGDQTVDIDPLVGQWLSLPQAARFIWSEEVWRPLLRDKRERPDRNALLEALGKLLAEPHKTPERQVARSSLLAGQPTASDVARFVSVDPVFATEQPWTDHGWAGEFLFLAADADVPTAQSVLDELIAHPHRFDPKLSHRVREALTEPAQRDAVHASRYIALCLSRDELNIVADTLAGLATPADRIVQMLADRTTHDIGLRDPRRRQNAFKLRAALHRRGFLQPDSWPWLKQKLDKERGAPDVLKHVITCAVASHRQAPFAAQDAQAALRFMSELGHTTTNSSLQQAALFAAAVIANVSINDLGTDEAIDAFLSEPLRLDKASESGYALENLTDQARKIEFLTALVVDPRVRTMASQARRGLSARLRLPVRRLFASVDDQTKAALLFLVPRTDEQVARCIIEAAGRHYIQLERAFSTLLAHPTMNSPALGQMLRRTTGKHEFRSAHWPELLDVLRTGTRG